MYLKRLEIQGFKSFAQKTVLEFLPPADGRFSVTAIVGPNGSGKSNISDAIRWVMGEQSLKVLRGKKSEDIIFSGSETKGQLGATEVTMVLENGDGRVLPDYPEITITRRLYRSGEGEYFINNSAVRLFDVRLLLAKAQFAEHAYSVIGQGMIDRLLSVSAADRKDFIDEASGIKEYQIKRHQADLKLARTVENMTQAERLLLEVEPRLKILSRQVRKLEKRQEVEMRLREQQEKYYATLYTRGQKDTAEVAGKLQSVENNYREAFARLEKTQNELASLSHSATRQETFTELERHYQEAHAVKNDLEKQLAILEGQLHVEYRETGRQNVGWLEGKVKELKNSRQKLSEDLARASSEAERLYGLLNENKTKLESLNMDKTQRSLKISRLQTEMLKDKSEQNYLQFSGLSAVKSVLDNRSRFGQVYGLLTDLGEVSEEYCLALEAAAGAYLTALVVEDEATARLAVEHLRANRLGVATFLPLSRIESVPANSLASRLLSYPDVLGLAVNFVKYNKKFEEVFSFVFGNTLVVKDLRAAEKMKGERARLVTLDGDLVERSGVIKGGFRQKKSNVGFSSRLSLNSGDRLVEYQTEINSEQQNLLETEKKIEEIKALVAGYEVEARANSARAGLLSEEDANLEKELANLERELSLTRVSPEEYSQELKRLSGDRGDLNHKIEAADKNLEKINKEMEDFNRHEEEKKQRLFSLQSAMQAEQNSVNKILSDRNDLKIEMAKLETKEESLIEEVLNDMNVSINSIMERNPVTVEADALPVVLSDIQKLKYQLSLIGGIDEEVTKEHAETKERFDFLTAQLEDLRAATDDLNKMIEELDKLMKSKRSAAFKKIRKEFDRYFKILFGGGKAVLEEVYGEVEAEECEAEQVENATVAISSSEEKKACLAEAPNETEGRRREQILTGIEVIVNPPGKKIKYINALSGGERTLTSIALICAILNFNPSPFVVLDEVEAALDEANTARFAKIMAELAAQSQFIIITHNRVTMHAADALYGVVMGGDAISKILSVKMSEAEKYDESPKSS